MADRIKGITIEIGGETTKLSKALQGVNSEIKTTQSGLKDVEKLLKMDPGNVDLLRQKQDYLNTAVEKTKEKIEEEKAALEQLKNTDGFDKNSEQAKALERQIIADEQELQRLTDESKSFGSVGSQQFQVAGKAIQEVGEKIKGVGDKISSIGTSMSAKVTAPIVGVGAASLAAFSEVDKGSDIIIAKTGAVGDAFEEMNDIMKGIATQIPMDFEAIGTAIGEVNTRFGVTGDELEALSTDFLKFAEINGTDVNSAIDSTQKALSAFGLGVEDASGLLDVMNKVGQNTGVSMDFLMSGLTTNAAVFSELGMSIEQSTAFLGQLEISGAEASTVMGSLQKALKNATADGTPLNEALANLQQTIMNGTGDVDGLTAAYDLFGKSGAQVFEAVRNGTIDFENMATAVVDAGGSVGDTYENMLDPVDEFKTTMNGVKIAGAELGSVLQQSLVPILNKTQEIIKKVTEKFKSLTPEQQQAIIKFGAIVAAIGPVLTIGGKLISGIGSVIVIGGKLVSAIGVVVGVLGGPLTAAIGAVIAIGVLLWKNWDTIKEHATALFNKMKDIFGNIKNYVTTTVSSMAQAVSDKFNAIKTGITDKINAAKDAVKNAIDKIKGLFKFEWSLPKLKMPHVSISGSFSLMPPSVPHFSIDWYKKAYADPVMFTKPTVIPTVAGMKGFGDGAGAEVVLGMNKLRQMVGQAGSTQNIQINVYGAQGQDVNALAEAVERRLVQAQRSRQAVFA